MTTSFFFEIVQATKAAQDVNAHLEKDADVLFKHVERRIKQTIKNAASCGNMNISVDLNALNLDLASKYSVKQLLFDKITHSFVPVSVRMFGDRTPFGGFKISEVAKNVFDISWSHGLVKPEPVVPPTEQEVQQFLNDLFPYLAENIIPKM
ncbi:hypothetical protein PBCVNEJV1_211R [Paramecium bursaria Chlorella virus NE-JV-1]|nr:hypothetical protein PBCVNEJV1_211R [Paramecium bursaria Chlorella virus NE-JV-1]